MTTEPRTTAQALAALDDEPRDFIESIERHRFANDAEKLEAVIAYARACESEIATIRDALTAASEAGERDARVAELEAALADIAHNTSTSVPLGAPREQHYEAAVRRCIGIAARALEPPAPTTVPYTNPCPKCDGRGFTREYIDGERESDQCGWCHGGGVVPVASPGSGEAQ